MADYVLSKDAARRVAAATRRLEFAKRNHVARAQGPRHTGYGARWFRTTTSFAAATDDGTTLTLQKGSGKLLKKGAAGTSTVPFTDAGLAAMDIYNGLNGTIAAGKVVKCILVDGLWVINLVWCG